MMTYATMTPEQIERVFGEDVLGWEEGSVYPKILWWMYEGKSIMYQSDFHPLADLNHAMLGVEKLEKDHNNSGFTIFKFEGTKGYRYYVELADEIVESVDNLNEAIVEACIRVKRPDLFEGE